MSKCESSNEDRKASLSQISKSVKFHSAIDVINGATKKRNRKEAKSCSKKKASMSGAAGRGRPRKTLVAMYHSQISGDKNAIKIRIKKSNLTTQIPVCMYGNNKLK